MNPIRVLVADDHDIVRFGICSALQTSSEIAVIGEAATGKETITLFKELKPDVVLLDITMPDMNGIDTTKTIMTADRMARILILSMHLDEEYLHQVLRAGALGYLVKSTEIKELVEAVKLAFNRQQVFSREVAEIMKERYVRNARTHDSATHSSTVNITQRELEIIHLIVEGKTSQEIGASLFISPRTVDTHRANLMQKLKLKNTAALVKYALESGITKGHT